MDVFREKRRAGQDDRARHARHGDRADAVRPRDADPRRRAALHRRARGDGAALLPAELRRRRSRRRPRRRRRGRRRQRARRRRAAARTRPASAVENVEQGDADRARRRARGAPRARARRSFGFHVRNADGQVGVRLQRARSDARGRPRARGCALRRDGREPAACPAATRRRLRPRRTASRATCACRGCGCCDFVVYGHGAGRTASSTCDADVEAGARGGRVSDAPARAARGPRPVGARRRLAARARAALPDRGRPSSSALLRHGARLPVVDRAAADAVRRAAGRLHAGLPARRPRSRTIPCCCCSTSCCSASSRRRPARR